VQFHNFDRDYLERLKARDFQTQEHFVAYFNDFTRLKFSKRMRSTSDVEDARQDTFVRFFTLLQKDGVREPGRIGELVNGICNMILLEYFRRKTHNITSDNEEAMANIPDTATNAVDLITIQELRRMTHETLDELREKDRRVLREVVLEERNKDEVCRDYNIERQNLRVLLHRAKKSFKSKYLNKIQRKPL
jgi:RNA polymerase sigma-70 factor (ECF subfamily)